jgi:4'-phosphopantetheinyl transferase
MKQNNKIDPCFFDLPENDVHIWLADLELSGEKLEYFKLILSSDESIRASKFHFEKDRKRYAIARGALRIILSKYLNIPEKDIHISNTKFGRPYVDEKHEITWLNFNLSHSNMLAIYAVTRSRDIGIDIEYVRQMEDANGIVQRFFSEEEISLFNSMPEDGKTWAFFKLWTRKEAYIKALGLGLQMPLNEFTAVSTLEEEQFLLENSNAKKNYLIKSLSLNPDYAGALAIESDEHMSFNFTINQLDILMH